VNIHGVGTSIVESHSSIAILSLSIASLHFESEDSRLLLHIRTVDCLYTRIHPTHNCMLPNSRHPLSLSPSFFPETRLLPSSRWIPTISPFSNFGSSCPLRQRPSCHISSVVQFLRSASPGQDLSSLDRLRTVGTSALQQQTTSRSSTQYPCSFPLKRKPKLKADGT